VLALTVIAGALAVGLAAYLVFAILYPERLS
jgi:K+-transporting ATPase KdpF subunit